MSPPPEDTPDLDLDRLVETLDRHRVDYLLVGGVAAIGHGAARTTYDVDCVPRPDLANLDRLADAMRELGARIFAQGLSDEEAKQLPIPLDGRTLARGESATWMTDAGRLDVLASIDAPDGRRVGYDELATKASIVRGAGVTIRAAGLDDMIASKEWAGRPKDLAALDELRALRTAQRPSAEREVVAPAAPHEREQLAAIRCVERLEHEVADPQRPERREGTAWRAYAEALEQAREHVRALARTYGPLGPPRRAEVEAQAARSPERNRCRDERDRGREGPGPGLER